MKQDSGLLHLAIESSRNGPGDLDIGVKQAFNRACIAAVENGVNGSPVGEHLQVDAGDVRVRAHHQVGGADSGMDGDQHAVVLGADQLVVGGRNRAGQGAVAEQGDVAAQDKGAKAGLGCSANENAVAGNQLGICGGLDIDGHVAILHEHCLLIAAEVGDSGFKGDWKGLPGLLVAEGVNWQASEVIGMAPPPRPQRPSREESRQLEPTSSSGSFGWYGSLAHSSLTTLSAEFDRQFTSA